MATFTPNFNLRKPAGSDLVDEAADLNANWDIVDTEIDNRRDEIAVHETRLDILDGGTASSKFCRVTHSTTTSCADATNTTIGFDTERFDTDTMHDTATNNSRITFTTAGIYVVGFHGNLVAAADYTRAFCKIRLNGTTELAYGVADAAPASTGPILSVSTVYSFAATDYIEVQVFQDNSANVARNLEKNNNYSPEFWACRIGKV